MSRKRYNRITSMDETTELNGSEDDDDDSSNSNSEYGFDKFNRRPWKQNNVSIEKNFDNLKSIKNVTEEILSKDPYDEVKNGYFYREAKVVIERLSESDVDKYSSGYSNISSAESLNCNQQNDNLSKSMAISNCDKVSVDGRSEAVMNSNSITHGKNKRRDQCYYGDRKRKKIAFKSATSVMESLPVKSDTNLCSKLSVIDSKEVGDHFNSVKNDLAVSDQMHLTTSSNLFNSSSVNYNNSSDSNNNGSHNSVISIKNNLSKRVKKTVNNNVTVKNSINIRNKIHHRPPLCSSSLKICESKKSDNILKGSVQNKRTPVNQGFESKKPVPTENNDYQDDVLSLFADTDILDEYGDSLKRVPSSSIAVGSKEKVQDFLNKCNDFLPRKNQIVQKKAQTAIIPKGFSSYKNSHPNTLVKTKSLDNIKPSFKTPFLPYQANEVRNSEQNLLHVEVKDKKEVEKEQDESEEEEKDDEDVKEESCSDDDMLTGSAIVEDSGKKSQLVDEVTASGLCSPSYLPSLGDVVQVDRFSINQKLLKNPIRVESGLGCNEICHEENIFEQPSPKFSSPSSSSASSVSSDEGINTGLQETEMLCNNETIEKPFDDAGVLDQSFDSCKTRVGNELVFRINKNVPKIPKKVPNNLVSHNVIERQKTSFINQKFEKDNRSNTLVEERKPITYVDDNTRTPNQRTSPLKMEERSRRIGNIIKNEIAVQENSLGVQNQNRIESRLGIHPLMSNSVGMDKAVLDKVKSDLFGWTCYNYLVWGRCNRQKCDFNHKVNFEMYVTALNHQLQEETHEVMTNLLDRLKKPPITLLDNMVEYFLSKKDLVNLKKVSKIFVGSIIAPRNRRLLFWKRIVDQLGEIFDCGKEESVFYLLENFFMDESFTYHDVNNFLLDYVVDLKCNDLWNVVQILSKKRGYFVHISIIRRVVKDCLDSTPFDQLKTKEVLDICRETLPFHTKDKLKIELQKLQRRYNRFNPTISSSLKDVDPVESYQRCNANSIKVNNNKCMLLTDRGKKSVYCNVKKPDQRIALNLYDNHFTSSGLSDDNKIKSKEEPSVNYHLVFCRMLRKNNFRGLFDILKSVGEKQIIELGDLYLNQTENDLFTYLSFLRYFNENKFSSNGIVNRFALYISWKLAYNRMEKGLFNEAFCIYEQMKKGSLSLLDPGLKFDLDGPCTPARRAILISDICAAVDLFQESIEILESKNLLDDPERWKISFDYDDVQLRNQCCIGLLKSLVEKKLPEYSFRLFRGLICSQNFRTLNLFHDAIIKEYFRNVLELLIDTEQFKSLYVLYKEVCTAIRNSKIFISNLLPHKMYRIILIQTLIHEGSDKSYCSDLLQELRLIGVYPEYKLNDKLIRIHSIWFEEEVKFLLQQHLLTMAAYINSDVLLENKLSPGFLRIEIVEIPLSAYNSKYLSRNLNTVDGTAHRIITALLSFDPPIHVQRNSNPRILIPKLTDLLNYFKKMRFG